MTDCCFVNKPSLDAAENLMWEQKRGPLSFIDVRQNLPCDPYLEAAPRLGADLLYRRIGATLDRTCNCMVWRGHRTACSLMHTPRSILLYLFFAETTCLNTAIPRFVEPMILDDRMYCCLYSR